MVPNLTNPKTVKSILTEHKLRPNKRLGQHFLINRRILERLLEAAELTPSDLVVEVGAGMGTITVELARKVEHVIALEVDQKLSISLRETISTYQIGENVTTITADALSLNPERLLQSVALNKYLEPRSEVNSKVSYKVLGAIPYQITSPLIHHLLTQKQPPTLITFIIQKEVGGKIVAKPPKATYLSNFVALFGSAKVVGKPIKPSAFWPQPEVNSAILKIKNSPHPALAHFEIGKLSRFLHRGFSHPRKMLKAAFDEKQLQLAGVDPTRRAQTLTPDEWMQLYTICQ